MRMIPLAVLGLLAGQIPAQAQSADGAHIVTSGSAGGAMACVSCHGANLMGNPAIKAPQLAGKPASYILARLAHYASPEGHNALMKAVATALTPPEKQAVAVYLEHLKPQPGP